MTNPSIDRVEFRERELARDEGDHRVLDALAATCAFGCLDRRAGGVHEPVAQVALLTSAMRLCTAVMVSSR